MKILYFLVVGFFVQAPAVAQALYKCGSTYSQMPCAPDAKKIELKPAIGIDCSSTHHMFTEACRGKIADAKSVTEARAKVQKQIDAMPPIVPPSVEVIEANKKRCLARIVAMLKDPESAKVGEVTRANKPDPDYETARGWFPSVSYNVSVNAKNSYGGYTGSKLWACSFDLKEQEILKARSIE